ncbi:hypothetical protein [Mariniblastus fucicola]|uniref:hypothetical protein n=1 Tax=Mariniblastus fucicola TaxID=980251 RepID=UPI0011DF26B5|nr:hypothetical protein [Mariniblastus fucicola]
MILILALAGCTNQQTSDSTAESTLQDVSALANNEHEEPSAQIERYIHELGDSKFLAKHDLYRKFFEIAKEDVLNTLVKHENDSVAVQSAWEIAVRTIPVDGENRPYKPDREKTRLFLKTLENRFQTQVPKWWRDVVMNCGANSRFSIYSGDPKVDPYHTVLTDERNGWPLIECPAGDQFIETSGGFQYKTAGDEILLPKSMFDSHRTNSGKISGHVTGAFSDSSFYVAFHRNGGRPFDLTCIDRMTGDIKWVSTVCGSSGNTIGSYLGDPTTWATIEIGDNNRLVIYGACPHGFFAHSFDQTDGKTLAEFSDGY